MEKPAGARDRPRLPEPGLGQQPRGGRGAQAAVRSQLRKIPRGEASPGSGMSEVQAILGALTSAPAATAGPRGRCGAAGGALRGWPGQAAAILFLRLFFKQPRDASPQRTDSRARVCYFPQAYVSVSGRPSTTQHAMLSLAGPAAVRLRAQAARLARLARLSPLRSAGGAVKSWTRFLPAAPGSERQARRADGRSILAGPALDRPWSSSLPAALGLRAWLLGGSAARRRPRRLPGRLKSG